jgi:general secretion pathway protein I
MSCLRAESRLRAAAKISGFTLIEVLAALVIVSLGMLGVIEAVTQQARNGAYLREKTLAHWVAMNVVTEQRLQAAPPPVAESSDEVEFAGRRWHWTMSVSQTQVEGLRRMDVSVRPADSADGVKLATVSGFYGSAIAPAGGGAVAWGGQEASPPEEEPEERPSKRTKRPPGDRPQRPIPSEDED